MPSGMPGGFDGFEDFPGELSFPVGRSKDVLKAPQPKSASPIGDVACPLGAAFPHLTTPGWGRAEELDGESPMGRPPPGPGLIGGLAGVDQWAWEMGSEAGSVPSVWSRSQATTKTQSSMASSQKTRLSTAAGDGLIPGLVEGQRLSTVKPSSVKTSGGKVVVCLRKEVPEGYWEYVGIVLVNGPAQVKLKPTGIKKGKKLCIEIPPGLKPGDYDMRLSFHDKMVHGAIPLAVRGNEDGSDDGGHIGG